MVILPKATFVIVLHFLEKKEKNKRACYLSCNIFAIIIDIDFKSRFVHLKNTKNVSQKFQNQINVVSDFQHNRSHKAIQARKLLYRLRHLNGNSTC